MAVKIHSTSTIDGIINVLRILVNFIYIITIVGGLMAFVDYINLSEILRLGENANMIGIVALFIGGMFLSTYLYRISAGRFFAVLSSFLYVRVELKTKISWKDASFVSFLFTANSTGKWYPMHNIIGLPKEQRVNYIISFAIKVLENSEKSN
jgi:hypothetical protein